MAEPVGHDEGWHFMFFRQSQADAPISEVRITHIGPLWGPKSSSKADVPASDTLPGHIAPLVIAGNVRRGTKK